MTVSGITTYSQTRDLISTDALLLLGVYSQGDTVTTNDLTFCSNILNKMVKGWEGQGIHIWTSQEGSLFLTAGKQHYDTSSTDPDVSGDDVVFDVLTVDGSGTALTVTQTTYMNVNDNIGIKLDNNTIQWTTISALPSSTTITLNASLTSAASSGNNVFVFTNRIDRPLHITSARFRSAGGYERPIDVKGRTEFMQMPNKATTGKANQWFYSPKVSDSRFYVWPTADDVGDCINISYVRRIQDMASGTDTPDLPQEWLECLTYNLAVRIAPAYGISTQKLNPDISAVASVSLQELTLWDSEESSLHIVPNYDWSN